MTIIIGIVCHHSSIMKVGRQDKWLVEHPVYHSRDLGLTSTHQVLLGQCEVIPGWEGTIEVDLISIVSTRPNMISTANSYNQKLIIKQGAGLLIYIELV